jgi:FkbM family methyltransferase
MISTIFHTNWWKQLATRGALAAKRDTALALAAERDFFGALITHLLDAQAHGRLAAQEVFAFYAFCQPRLARTQSQILQDLWVLFMTREKRGGFFVEFGACDGILLSNTLLLERDFGWNGILAEPNPVWHQDLRRNRKCAISTECVYSRTGEELAFMATETMPELSRIASLVPDDVHERNGARAQSHIFSAPTITLQHLLQKFSAPREIDYLSIDTEGSELEIIGAFDFAEYVFHLITVEHAGESQKRESIRCLLEKHGYTRWFPELTRWDDWYVRR